MKHGCHFGHTMCHATRPNILNKISLLDANNTFIIITRDRNYIVKFISKAWVKCLAKFSGKMVFFNLDSQASFTVFDSINAKRANLSQRETRWNEKDRFRFICSGAL